MIDGFKDTSYTEIINGLCPELKTSEPGKLESKKLPRLKNVITVGAKIDGAYTWEEALELADTVPL